MNDVGDARSELETMSVQGLVEEFNDTHREAHDRAFAFVLGAGASRSSGIRAAADMAGDWVRKLHVRSGSTAPWQEWATAASLNISRFDADDLAAAYPQLYARLYGRDPGRGHAYLEEQMREAEPSYGYCVLADILAKTRHRVVVTTNFDNLVADSLSIFSETFPLICGHESLASFVRARLGRPLVVKVHRDLLLGPKSAPEDLAGLPAGYAQALDELFGYYTPIVIGYGGNDGSLMGYFENLAERKLTGGVYWCYWEGGEEPNSNIQRFVARQGGYLVRIPGFDELMLLLGNQLKFQVPVDFVLQRAKRRAQRIEDQVAELLRRFPSAADAQPKPKRQRARRGQPKPAGSGFEPARDSARMSQPSGAREHGTSSGTEKFAAREAVKIPGEAQLAVGQALAGIATRGTRDRWWQWEAQAAAESDPVVRQQIYEKAILALPDSAPLLGNFALFLEQVVGDYDRAEEIHKRAIAAKPDDANNLGNFATFLEQVREDYEHAEELYERAIAAQPDNAIHLGNFAHFLQQTPKNYDRAEELYKRAIAAQPDDADNLGNFAMFLEQVRKDYGRAEELYGRAIAAQPDNANHLGNFAIFLEQVRKDYKHAQELYERAIVAQPDDADNLDNFAMFFEQTQKNYDRAEELYERAIAARPDHADSLGHFGVFLEQVRKDYERAEKLFKRALDAQPDHANNLVSFAGLKLGRGQVADGLALLHRALQIGFDDDASAAAEAWMYGYCFFPDDQRKQALRELRLLIDGDVRTDLGFSVVIEQALQRSHEAGVWLQRLEEVLSGKEDPILLEAWPAWVEAGRP